MPPCWVGHNYDSCARLSYSPWQSEFIGGFLGPSLLVFFDSVVAKAGFGGEQRQSRFDGVMAWWPAAMLSARAGTGRREHLSPHPAAGCARGESTAKITTVFTTRFHAQAQQKPKSTTKCTTIFTQVFTTIFTQAFATLWWTESTPRLSNIHLSIHHRIHSSIHLDIHPAGTIIVTVAGIRVKLVRQNIHTTIPRSSCATAP